MDEHDATLAELEKWFNSAQDRAQQWFTTRTRFITVVASLVTALVLQVDAVELIHRISSEPDVRSKLVSRADNLQKDAEKAFQNANIGDPKIHAAVLVEMR